MHHLSWMLLWSDHKSKLGWVFLSDQLAIKVVAEVLGMLRLFKHSHSQYDIVMVTVKIR